MPGTFYYGLESIGNLEPDAVVQQGIKVMQQKLAAVLQELAGDENNDAEGMDGFGGPRSPDGLGAGVYEPEGYTTPFVNPGATSAWGGVGGATPYGQTPFGGQGWNH